MRTCKNVMVVSIVAATLLQGGCAARIIAPAPVAEVQAGPVAVTAAPAAVVVAPAPVVVARRGCGWVMGPYGRVHRTWRCW